MAAASTAPPSLGSRAATFALAAALAGPALLVVGAVLKATTHHRALGGTTFALVALFIGGGSLALGARGGALADRWADGSPARARVLTLASAALVVAVLGALALVAARGSASGARAPADAADGPP